MADYQLTHHRPDNFDLDRRIQGFKINYEAYHTIDEVIGFIRAGHTFWTGTILTRAEVREHIHPRSGRPYLKTDADGVEPNNLLALPIC